MTPHDFAILVTKIREYDSEVTCGRPRRREPVRLAPIALCLIFAPRYLSVSRISSGNTPPLTLTQPMACNNCETVLRPVPRICVSISSHSQTRNMAPHVRGIKDKRLNVHSSSQNPTVAEARQHKRLRRGRFGRACQTSRYIKYPGQLATNHINLISQSTF